MKEQFVTYDIALKLEQLGFNEKCFGYYKTTLCNNIPELNIIQCNYNSGKYITIPEDFLIDAPLWQQVIDWFRVKYNLNIEVIYLPNICKYGFIISDKGFIPKNHTFKENYSRGSIVTDNFIKFDEYYDARKHMILKAIELCKQDVKKMDVGQE